MYAMVRLGRKDKPMSKDEFLQQYAVALQAQAAAETQVKVLEMRAKLEFGNPIDSGPGAIAAIDKYGPDSRWRRHRGGCPALSSRQSF